MVKGYRVPMYKIKNLEELLNYCTWQIDSTDSNYVPKLPEIYQIIYNLLVDYRDILRNPDLHISDGKLQIVIELFQTRDTSNRLMGLEILKSCINE